MCAGDVPTALNRHKTFRLVQHYSRDAGYREPGLVVVDVNEYVYTLYYVIYFPLERGRRMKIHTFVTAVTISAENEDVFNAAMQAVNDRLVELHLNLDIHCCDDATMIPDDATVSWTSSHLFDHSVVIEGKNKYWGQMK